MISKKIKDVMQSGSAIRAMFEEGKRLAQIYGKENVYDFSLGNPSVPAPKAVNEAIKQIAQDTDALALHGYMLNSGFESVRGTIADSLNSRFDTAFTFKNIIMTVGAAGGLNVALKSIINDGDEVVVFAPYFGEYNNYVANVGGKIVYVSARLVGAEDFDWRAHKSGDCQFSQQSVQRNLRRRYVERTGQNTQRAKREKRRGDISYIRRAV